VRATGEQRGQNHQVGQGKQPLLRLRSCGFRCSRDHAQMTAARKVVQVLHANPRQTGHFRIRKDLLTRLDLNQGNLSIHQRFRLLNN
jgi:hypothetical protein